MVKYNPTVSHSQKNLKAINLGFSQSFIHSNTKKFLRRMTYRRTVSQKSRGTRPHHTGLSRNEGHLGTSPPCLVQLAGREVYAAGVQDQAEAPPEGLSTRGSRGLRSRPPSGRAESKVGAVPGGYSVQPAVVPDQGQDSGLTTPLVDTGQEGLQRSLTPAFHPRSKSFQRGRPCRPLAVARVF